LPFKLDSHQPAIVDQECPQAYQNRLAGFQSKSITIFDEKPPFSGLFTLRTRPSSLLKPAFIY
jgi:hypothetical protein